MDSLITVTAVGDIMLGDHPVRIGNGVRSQIEREGTGWLFSRVKHLFEESDIVFGNLEVVHSDVEMKANDLASIEFRGAPESLADLRNAGFNVLGFANNHCMEHGRGAFLDTVDRLKRTGIAVAGLRKTGGEAIPYEMMKHGRRIALLAYSMRPEAYSTDMQLPYALSNEPEILKQVIETKNTADIVIVSLHWGEEFMEYPSQRQVKFAHNLVDAGACLILGHHPHVLQGIEEYRGAVIAYSLGNFVFDMWQRETRISMVLRARVYQDGTARFEIIPTEISDSCQPVPLEDGEMVRARRDFEALSSKILCLQGSEVNHGKRKVRLLSNDGDYLALATKRTLHHRLGNYMYFVRNIYRYRTELVAQSVRRSIYRRFGELYSFVRGDRSSN